MSTDCRSGEPDTLGEVKGLVACGDNDGFLLFPKRSSENKSDNNVDFESVLGDLGVKGEII